MTAKRMYGGMRGYPSAVLLGLVFLEDHQREIVRATVLKRTCYDAVWFDDEIGNPQYDLVTVYIQSN